MSGSREFLDPAFTVATLDTAFPRRAVLQALRAHLPELHGTVLDVGCGYMAYRPLVLAPPSRADRYIGLDLADGAYGAPDLTWDGVRVDLPDAAVDCVLLMEVLEHCPDPGLVLRETRRLLKPGGPLFVTVPFLWPLHDTPHDECRYTPFALERLLRAAGYEEVRLRALGGWDGSLAQLLALWVRRRPMAPFPRAVLSRLALPVVRWLAGRDRAPGSFADDCMLTGLSATARNPRRG